MNKINLSKELKTAKKWLGDLRNRHFCYEAPNSNLLNGLEKPIVASCTIYLQSISSFEGVTGECCLLEGDDKGWFHIHKSYLYRCWAARIVAAFQVKEKKRVIRLKDVALWLTHAVMIKDDLFADWIGNLIVTSLNEKPEKFIEWDITPFEPFAIKLYGLWRNILLDYSRRKVCALGVYQKLLDHWRDEVQLNKILLDACDYHLANTDDPKDQGFPEFSYSPYNLLPVEILAIQRIRREQGFSTPEIDHPLMQTPLAHLPEKMPEVRDELLEKVIAKARAELPIGNPW